MELNKYLDKEAFYLLEQYVLQSKSQQAYSIWSMLYNPAMLPYKRNELATFTNSSPYCRAELVVNCLDEIVKVFVRDIKRLTGKGYKTNDILGCIAKVAHSVISYYRNVSVSGNDELIEQLKQGKMGIEKALDIIKGKPEKKQEKKIKELIKEKPKESKIGFEDFKHTFNSFISKINPYCYLHERYETDFTELELINCQRLLQILKTDLLTIETQIIKIKEIKS